MKSIKLVGKVVMVFLMAYIGYSAYYVAASYVRTKEDVQASPDYQERKARAFADGGFHPIRRYIYSK